MRSLAPLLVLVTLTITSESGPAPAAQAVRAPITIPPVKLIEDRPFSKPFSVTSPSGTVFLIPSDCLKNNNKFDLVVHFHGAPQVVERGVNEAELDAVVVTINKGIRASAYGDAMHDEHALDRLMDASVRRVKKECNKRGVDVDPEVGRVALSAWSAGFQGIYRIIRRDHQAERVDAVLLADALHAALRSERPRLLSEVQLGPFVEFGALAAKGRKLMALTHSSIPTPGYASTTETANFIVDSLGLSLLEQQDRPWWDTRMKLDSGLLEGAFVVLGYEGQQAKDHGDHLRQLGKTLFPVLREYWKEQN